MEYLEFDNTFALSFRESGNKGNTNAGGDTSLPITYFSLAKLAVSVCFYKLLNSYFLQKQNMAQELKHDVLKKMKLGGRPKVFRFDTPGEFESARRNAAFIQKNCPRPDGAKYCVKCSYQSGTITVTLTN